MAKAETYGDGKVKIKCPGCGNSHFLNVTPENGRPCWTFNGDYEKPTFQPSLLERSGHYVDPSADCWCTYEQRFGEKPGFDCYICHSFITDGMIQFLGDCTHDKAGQTLPLLDV